jgi:hypothetical protein
MAEPSLCRSHNEKSNLPESKVDFCVHGFALKMGGNVDSVVSQFPREDNSLSINFNGSVFAFYDDQSGVATNLPTVKYIGFRRLICAESPIHQETSITPIGQHRPKCISNDDLEAVP